MVVNCMIEFSVGTQENQKRLAGGCNEWSATERVAARQTSFASRPASGARVPGREFRFADEGLGMCEVEWRAFVI